MALDIKIRDEAIRRLKLGQSRVSVRDDLGLSGNQMSGICYRMAHAKKPKAVPVYRDTEKPAIVNSTYGGWTETVLTEKWSDYSARRKAERAAAKAAKTEAAHAGAHTSEAA